MKIKGVVVFVFLFLVRTAFAGTIVLEGVYQGKNLLVQNPIAGSGVGFCVSEVFVNDVRTTDETQSSAFEIDLAFHRLKIGQKVIVKIRHKDDCKPRVMNPEVIKPASTYEMISFKAENGQVVFSTKGETGSLPFVVEQFRWNKWVKAGEVSGKGTPEQHDYVVKVKNHSGINKFRVQQTDYTGKPKLSNQVQYLANVPVVTFYPARVTKDLNFSAETMYEIFDSYGSLVKKGIAQTIDLSAIAQGIYYLNYDNKSEKFIKK